MANNDIDITKNIKVIESFKCELLNSVAELYSGMLKGNITAGQRAETLSNILIITYLLSDKLGVSFNTLDSKALSKIRLGILENNSDRDWQAELLNLGRHIDKTRDLSNK